jgi:hypothetical protein
VLNKKQHIKTKIMRGITKRRLNLMSKNSLKDYSGNDKNTLKSRIMAMDKGWIAKKKEIKSMNRTAGKLKSSAFPVAGTEHR